MERNMQKSVRNIGLFVIILAVIIVLFIILARPGPIECETEFCFIEHAEKCTPAIIEVQDDDQIVTSRVAPDCSVSILIEYIDENGEKEVFSKKTCFYEKNKFVETILESDVVTCKTE